MTIRSKLVRGLAFGAGTALIFAGGLAAQNEQGGGSEPQPPSEGAKPDTEGDLEGEGELILDPSELKTLYSEALTPLREHLEKSALDKRYAEITEILQPQEGEEDVDGDKLIAALRQLKGELDSFVTGLPTIREKLFTGSDNLGDRIHDFRMVLARTRDNRDGRISSLEDGQIDASQALDDELTTIAREIKAAEDPRRKALLKERFKFLYLARQRLDQVDPELGGLDETVMSNVLQFVLRIRAHLDNAATSTITMQMGLQQQQKMIGRFLVLIENLQATGTLAEEIEELSEIEAPNFSELTQKMNEVTESLLTYTDRLESKAGAATQKLAEKLQNAPVEGGVQDPLELDRLIEEAAARGGPEAVEASTPSSGDEIRAPQPSTR